MKLTLFATVIFCVCFTFTSFNNLQISGTSQTIGTNGGFSLESTRTSFFEMDTLEQISTDLKTLVKGKILRTFSVDFNGDGSSDFICQYEPVTKIENADYMEDWITSDFQLFKSVKKYSMDYDFFWFVNLDTDPEPEIFSAAGYEDGIDYAFYDQNLKSGKDKLLFYFNPVILENGKYYWGYPWNITDIIIKRDSAKIYLKSSVANDIERDGNITIPDSTKSFPAIFFLGRSSQTNLEVGEIGNVSWTTIDELR